MRVCVCVYVGGKTARDAHRASVGFSSVRARRNPRFPSEIAADVLSLSFSLPLPLCFSQPQIKLALVSTFTSSSADYNVKSYAVLGETTVRRDAARSRDAFPSRSPLAVIYRRF